jgi:hypothetical protein
MLKGYSPLQVFLLFTFLFTLLPTVVGFVRYKRVKAEYKALVWLSVLTFILDGTSNMLWLQKMNNIFISNFHTLLQFGVISYIYHKSFKGFVPKNFILWVGFAFLVFFTINMATVQGFWLMNTYSKTLESIILIVYALMSFYQFANELKIERISEYPMFWFSSGVLIYFSSNIFIFILSNYFLEYSTQFYVRIWAIHAIFYIAFQIICALTLWLSSKK